MKEVMTLLHEAVEAKKLDTRLVERNIARGVLKPEDMKKAVDQLPDDSAGAEWANIETLAAELGNSGSDSGRESDTGSFGGG